MPRRVLAAAIAVGAIGAGAIPEPPPALAQEEPVLEERFEGPAVPEGWRAVEGQWSVVDGRLVGRSASSSQIARLTFGPRLENYRIEATLRFESVESATRWTAVGLDMPADGSVPWWHAALRSGSTASNGVEFAERTAANTWNVTNAGSAPSAAGTGRDVEVAIEVRGSNGRWLFDGQEVLRTTALRRSRDGRLGFVVNGASVSFDDVKLTELEPEPLVLPDDDATVPRVVAHRGYSSVTPENTLAAMAAGQRSGADFIEVDVATSADGVPYILHDHTVDRTTEGSGRLDALTADYLDELETGAWFSPAFFGQPFPRLDAMLDELERGSGQLLLEVKGPETRAEVEAVIEVLRERGMIGRTLLQTFDEQVLRHAREIEPELRLGLLRSTLDADPVAIARDVGVVAYNPSWNALRPRSEEIARLNAAGVAVMPYTVNDPGQWSQMRDAGVDAVITDRPGALVGWNARYVQAGKPVAVKADILAPVDGARLRRGESVAVALDTGGAGEVTVTLDGEPVTEGALLHADELELGVHELRVEASGSGGQAVESEARFVVRASEAGLAHLVAVAPGVPDPLRVDLLRDVLGDRWRSVVKTVERHERKFDDGAAELILGDAQELIDRWR
jgi:glycerophosphoryl diester phosphodiesterase